MTSRSFLFAFIHRSAWNRNSRKFISRILHSPGQIRECRASHETVGHAMLVHILWC